MLNYCYGLLIREDKRIEVVRRKDGMPSHRWIREILSGFRYGDFAESSAPGGVLLFCPGAAKVCPINRGAVEILRGKETVCGAELYLPGKDENGYRLYTLERAERERKILEVLLK